MLSMSFAPEGGIGSPLLAGGVEVPPTFTQIVGEVPNAPEESHARTYTLCEPDDMETEALIEEVVPVFHAALSST
jgi:hypothetical protein